jgi:hypothetical protein
MKKVLLSLGLLTALTTAAQAQVTFGLKAGVSFTNMSGKDADGFAGKVGGHGGVAANFQFTDAISLQPEVLFSMKGAQDENVSKVKLNLNYIDIPVMFQYNLEGLFFEAGPQLGILATAKITDGTNDIDMKDNLNTVDVGYAVGLGYKMETGFMTGLRYNGGLTTIDKVSTGGTVGDLRNNAFQLYLGFMFGGK